MPIPDLFTSPRAQVDLTKFGPAHWNAVTALLTALFDGADADGTVLARDSTSETGAAWVVGGGGGVGPQGPQGEPGETGATGAAGSNGAAGAAGSQGIQGSQGIPGDAGAAGAAGAQGIQGVPGDTGPAGADGADGGSSGLSCFRLTADLTAFGPAIGDYFGANSALETALDGIYELTYYLWFVKTGGSTMVYTITNSQTYAHLNAAWVGTIVGGIAATGNTPGNGLAGVTTAAAAFPATGTIAGSATHHVIVRALAVCSAAGNIRLRVTPGTGTITPLKGSYYTARQLDPANVGTFVA